MCWSCGKEIPNDANRCLYCEAEVESEPTDEELRVVKDMLAHMSPDVISELRSAFEESQTGEDFVNRIMVGDCPKCESSKTDDCGDDPEVDDICVGRCFDCGQLWCLECGQLLQKHQATCSCCNSSEELE